VGRPLGWLLVGCDVPAGDHSKPSEHKKTLTNNGLPPSAFCAAGDQ